MHLLKKLGYILHCSEPLSYGDAPFIFLDPARSISLCIILFFNN